MHLFANISKLLGPYKSSFDLLCIVKFNVANVKSDKQFTEQSYMLTLNSAEKKEENKPQCFMAIVCFHSLFFMPNIKLILIYW